MRKSLLVFILALTATYNVAQADERFHEREHEREVLRPMHRERGDRWLLPGMVLGGVLITEEILRDEYRRRYFEHMLYDQDYYEWRRQMDRYCATYPLAEACRYPY